MKQCSVEGCANKVHGKGFCHKHYDRWRRHKNPLGGGTGLGEPLAWLKHAIKTKSENCLIWPFAKKGDGYGHLRYKGKNIPAHRLALMLHEGRETPPDNMECAHAPVICHTPLCINPDHLRWASRKENEADKLFDNTLPRGERQGSSRLTKTQVLRIREDNRTLKEIAFDYSVCPQTICNVKLRRTWGWL